MSVVYTLYQALSSFKVSLFSNNLHPWFLAWELQFNPHVFNKLPPPPLSNEPFSLIDPILLSPCLGALQIKSLLEK